MSGLKDIKSSLRGAKLPNGQPMLLDEEQNSLALLIEQVSTAALQHCSAATAGPARAELRRPAQGGVLHEPGRHHQRPGAAGQDSAGRVQGRQEGEIRAANYPSVFTITEKAPISRCEIEMPTQLS